MPPAVSTPTLPSAEQVESALWLEGMHCAACAGVIEAAVAAVHGVDRVQVSVSVQRARVAWDRSQTDLSRIIQAIEAAGYGAVPASPQRAQAARQSEKRILLWRLFVAWFCALQVMMLATPAYVAGPGEIVPDLARLMNWAQWLLCLPLMAFSAWPFMRQAAGALRHRRIVMEVPVALGMLVMFAASSVATFAPDGPLGQEVVFDSLSMFAAILLAGRWVEMRLRHDAAQALERITDRPSNPVLLVSDDGSTTEVRPENLSVGDRIRVPSGECFPADGLVLCGRALVSESVMTGESLPVLREPGQQVLCGSVNHGDPVELCVTAIGQHTRWSRLVDLAERAAMERPALLQMADRWAGPVLWAVLVLAAVSGLAWWWIEPARALWVAVSVLVVTCPCALSLAAPAALAAASRGFAGQGALLQRLSALEDLARVDTLVLDKTGTLTQDRLFLTDIVGPEGEMATHKALMGAASLATWSHHPAARALVEAAQQQLQRLGRAHADHPEWTDVREKVGHGVEGVDAQGVRWRLGRDPWVRGERLGPSLDAHDDSSVHLAFGPVGVVVAAFALTDTPRPEAAQAMADLRALGVQPWILSGDAPRRVSAMAATLGLPVLRAGALPEDKQAAVAALQAAGHVVAMVGDGINDAPVLAQAQVSLAMGHGSAASIAKADVVIHPANLEVLPRLIGQARRTQAVIRQNLGWALFYNLAAVPVALAGHLPPWLAGLGMTLSSLLVVLNSRRASQVSVPIRPMVEA